MLYSYFRVPKDIKQNATHYFLMIISNKRELQKQNPLNHSSNIDFKKFVKLYENYNKKPYSFLVNNTTLASDNPLRFKKDLLFK